MSLREWLIAIGALVLIVIVIDGIRRMRRASKDSITISTGMGANDIEGTPLDDDFNPELPNGGARPVSRDTLEQRGYVTKAPVKTRQSEPTEQRGSSAPKPPATRPVVNAPPAADPADVEAGDPGSPATPPPRKVKTPVMRAEPTERSVAPEPRVEPHPDAFPDEALAGEPGLGPDEPFADLSAADYQDPEAVDEPGDVAGLQAEPRSGRGKEPVARNRWASSLREMGRRLVSEQEPEPPTVTTEVEEDTARRQPATAPARDQPLAGANRPAAEEVIVINVLAREQDDFSGTALKRLFEACGLEHGDLDIYHRHEAADTTSPVQFSVANAVEPGTFTPARMAAMSTPGISFFMSLPGPSNSLQAFEFMLETAQCVVRNLGGELKDERRSVMTAQTIEHCRQRIREYERKRHSRR